MDKEVLKILVIDDEPPICELMDEFLSIKGYQVITASNGEEGISKFEENRPQLVLLDLRMPGMSGIEVLSKLKEIDGHAGIIILSAFGDVNTIQEALEIGATYYMEKPIELQRLAELLEAWQGNLGGSGSNDIS